jgi:hypothetical protein
MSASIGGLNMTPDIMAQMMAALQSRGMSVSGSGDIAGAASSFAAGAARGAASQMQMNTPQGRSRKYREEAGWEVTGPMAGLANAGAMLTVCSPVVPLKFEQPPGKWQSEWRRCGLLTGLLENKLAGRLQLQL